MFYTFYRGQVPTMLIGADTLTSLHLKESYSLFVCLFFYVGSWLFFKIHFPAVVCFSREDQTWILLAALLFPCQNSDFVLRCFCLLLTVLGTGESKKKWPANDCVLSVSVCVWTDVLSDWWMTLCFSPLICVRTDVLSDWWMTLCFKSMNLCLNWRFVQLVNDSVL